MFTNKWFLPTISDLLAEERANNNLEENSRQEKSKIRKEDLRSKAEREWYGAIAAVNKLLLNQVREVSVPEVSNYQGLVLSGPTPILSNPALASSYTNSVFTGKTYNALDWLSVWARTTLPMLPASERTSSAPPTPQTLPLWGGDPLAKEPFSLVLTASFSLVMVLGKNTAGDPAFLFSFDPEIVGKAWTLLRQRILLIGAYCHTQLTEEFPQIEFGGSCSNRLTILDSLVEEFAPIAPNYKIVMQFGRWLLENMPPEGEKIEKLEKNLAEKVKSNKNNNSAADVELLQAIAHEVKTPLATIRTLTRLLLKRPNIDPETLKKRLQTIDSECTNQIDRFGLFFRAVELETQQQKQCQQQTKHLHLTSISLGEFFENSLPKWQKKATQRNHTLEVILPPYLPTVVSDATMLDQVLGSLIENFSRNLPAGSHIQVEVNDAGDRLKLQLKSQPKSGVKDRCLFAPNGKTSFKSIGPLLMFQPETGSLSLNLNVTKNLFEAMGGKLVVRQGPEKGEVMTIFLPLK
jgi:signal transduction histidine kinase